MEKAISIKGRKEVAALTSAERGKLIIVVICMTAVGSYIPSLIIWPRKNMRNELMDGLHLVEFGLVIIQVGYGHIFTMWFDLFIKHVNPTADDPVLLVLDGYTSYTRNIKLHENQGQTMFTYLPATAFLT